MDYKYIGILDSRIAEKWGISEHKNKPILVFDNKREHVIDNHLEDFGNEANVDKVYNSLSNIIKKPDYVYYDSNKKGLEYYKKLDNNICVAVRVNPGRTLKVKSWYPVKESKIENRKKKEKQIFDN